MNDVEITSFDSNIDNEGINQDNQRSLKRVADRNNKKVFFRKRKGCPLSTAGAPAIDYKNPDLLSKFTSECSRVLPGRITNVSRSKQKQLARAIKIARELALIRFVYNQS